MKRALLAFALAWALFPAASQAQNMDQRLAGIASRLGNSMALMRTELALYDETNRIQVAQGRMSVADADGRLRAMADQLLRQALSTNDVTRLQGQQRQAVQAWISAISQRVRQGAQWPEGGAQGWQALAQQEVSALAAKYDNWISKNLDPRLVLADIAKVQGWTYGRIIPDPASDPFAGEDQRIASAFSDARARDMMAITLGLKTVANESQPLPQPAPAGANIAALPPAATNAGPEPQQASNQPPSAPQTTNRPQNSPPQQNLTGLDANVDRPGGDFFYYNLYPNMGADYCRQLCESNGQCRAFSYVRPGVQGPAAVCWLKNTVPQAVANNCCVSGVNRSSYGGNINLGQNNAPQTLQEYFGLPQNSGQNNKAATFQTPMINGYFVDRCLGFGSDCDQPAADAFCRQQGYRGAIEFRWSYKAPTRTLKDNRVCDNAKMCGGFDYIACAQPTGTLAPRRQ